MSIITETAKKRLGSRRRAEKRFKLYSRLAILVAISFLIFFLYDMIRTGYPAFTQAELLVEVSYSEESMEIGQLAVDEEMERLVSRGFLRIIPMRMQADPALLGVTRDEWVLAVAEVDQYLKGKPNRLREDERETVQRLQDEGRVKMAFNTGFFVNGDSKLPEMAGVWAALVGSAYVLLLTLAFSFPVGVLTAVYLEEFAPDNRLTQIVEVNINNLAAIPSILYGLLGLAIFINFFHVPRSSALVGGLTLALMTMPVIIISTRAALRSVPGSIREAAYGIGATPWQVVWHHTLPLALPGVLTGTIIGLARAIGESAPLLIIGMMAYIPDAPHGVTEAATALPAQIYTWSTDSQRAFTERTAAAIVVLLAVLLSMNALAIYMRNKYERKW
ncbi:phosphate ABC transporter permease PstA [Desulfocurvibacter africanus]|uniref:phosphate ABC transporter permease PstA n=1 Tax=Desulfocurvibacter africanus TaxID=873 RepID=UPI000409C62C|nr:phosphate ABC transporter permease PstA [Desulfocurvibacter africanus]